MHNLLNKILYLVPDAACTVTVLDNTMEYSNEDVHERCGYKIVWSRQNTKPCPSEKELNSVKQKDADAEAEIRNFKQRCEGYKKVQTIVASYTAAKISNQNLPWEDFIRTMESNEND